MTPFRAAALAVLVLLGSPACAAQFGVKENKPAAPNGASDGACSAAQLAEIDAAFQEARAALRLSLERLSTDPQHPELRRWFGTTSGKLVRANLERIATRVDQGRPADTACNHPTSCRGTSFAYTRPATGALGMCPPFFRAANRGQDSRFGIVVHEMSHLAIGTRDTTYQPHQVLVLAKDDPAAAAMNADNYEYLVETLYR